LQELYESNIRLSDIVQSSCRLLQLGLSFLAMQIPHIALTLDRGISSCCSFVTTVSAGAAAVVMTSNAVHGELKA
jgi:hypothetical protein